MEFRTSGLLLAAVSPLVSDLMKSVDFQVNNRNPLIARYLLRVYILYTAFYTSKAMYLYQYHISILYQ